MTKRLDLSLDKNCDREVQLRICAGRLFHAVGADIENELSTQLNSSPDEFLVSLSY